MIIKLSKDKTALVGVEQGQVSEASAEFVLVDNLVYLKDGVKKVRFKVSQPIRDAILNKGYLILCEDNPFNFFKVKMKVNG